MTDEAQGGSPLDLARALREFGLGLPDTEEGIACVGTPLEKRTLTTRRKAFLFLGAGDAMFKLRASLPQAIASAAGDPMSNPTSTSLRRAKLRSARAPTAPTPPRGLHRRP